MKFGKLVGTGLVVVALAGGGAPRSTSREDTNND